MAVPMQAILRKLFRLLPLLLLLNLIACSSPNRGIWAGTFDGDISGTVEFEINTRGTQLKGEMEGETRGGQPFKADMEGTLDGSLIHATFTGVSRTGALPVFFDGSMSGDLFGGEGEGDWECEIRHARIHLKGNWITEQVE